jgi:hypothetical protein
LEGSGYSSECLRHSYCLQSHKGTTAIAFQGPSVGRTKELLKPNRNQLWWVTGLIAGNYLLKGHLFKMGLTDSPICERCLEKDESATHILCDCEAIAYLKFRHMGHYCMEPGDYQDAPLSRILHFVQSIQVGLLKGRNRGGCTIDH